MSRIELHGILRDIKKEKFLGRLKERGPIALVTIGFFQLTLFVFGPLNLYKLNIEEFTLSIFWLLQFLIIPLVLLTVVYVSVCVLLGNGLFEKTISLTVVLSILLYFQGNFLVWDYGIFDGREIEWSKHHVSGIIEIGIWIFCLALGWKLSARLKAKAAFISLFLILVQFFSFGLDVYATPEIIKNKAPEKASSSIYSFSKERNIVVIVLDAFLSPAFEDIIEEKPEWKERFSDFLYFRNTLAPFPTTKPSVPAILTGQTYDNSVPYRNYMKRVLPGQSLPSVLYKNGYQVDLAGQALGCDVIQATSCAHPSYYRPKDRTKVEIREMARLIDVVLFRYLPHFAKILVHNNHSWFLQQFFAEGSGAENHLDAIALAESIQDRARIGNAKATFKWYHLVLPHSPLQRDENCRFTQKTMENIPENFSKQAECALDLAMKIITKMKALDVYHQSMIFVLADHGVALNFGQDQKKEGFPDLGEALPLLLIKPFNRMGDLAISDVPASLTDIPRTIDAILGLEAKFPGLSLFDLRPDQMRDRRYFHYQWRHKYWWEDYVPTIREYSVMGDAWLLKSWKRLETVHKPHDGSIVDDRNGPHLGATTGEESRGGNSPPAPSFMK